MGNHRFSGRFGIFRWPAASAANGDSKVLGEVTLDVGESAYGWVYLKYDNRYTVDVEDITFERPSVRSIDLPGNIFVPSLPSPLMYDMTVSVDRFWYKGDQFSTDHRDNKFHTEKDLSVPSRFPQGLHFTAFDDDISTRTDNGNRWYRVKVKNHGPSQAKVRIT